MTSVKMIRFQTHKPFEEFRNEIEGNNTTINTKERISYTEDSNFDQYIKYPINILTASSDKLPNKVDALRKEVPSQRFECVYIFSNYFNHVCSYISPMTILCRFLR